MVPEHIQASITVKDVLTDTLNILYSIRVPASEIEEVGIPVAKAIQRIRMCVNAFEHIEDSAENMNPDDFSVEVEEVKPDEQ